MHNWVRFLAPRKEKVMFSNGNIDLFYAFLAIHKAAKDRGILFTLDIMYLQKIFDRYNEPWRRYHTLAHIDDGCRKILALWDTIEDSVSTMLAWIHHDIVFLTTTSQGENEERSAQIVEALHGKVNQDVIKRAAAIIRATNGHLLPDTFCGNMGDLALVLDVDLSSFGNPHDKFVADGELIREELDLTPEEWRVGRSNFANMLLTRPSVFKTKHFAQLEEQARKNLRWAVNQSS